LLVGITSRSNNEYDLEEMAEFIRYTKNYSIVNTFPQLNLSKSLINFKINFR